MNSQLCFFDDINVRHFSYLAKINHNGGIGLVSLVIQGIAEYLEGYVELLRNNASRCYPFRPVISIPVEG